jgi:hypothetical protein
MRKKIEKVRKKCPSRDILWLSAIGSQPEKTARRNVVLPGAASPDNEEAAS